MSIALLDKPNTQNNLEPRENAGISAAVNQHLEKEQEEDRQDTERFVRCCGHDLREPLRTVNSMLSLLRKDNFHTLDERSGQYIDLSLKATRQMDHLVQYLSDYIALEDSKPVLNAISLTVILEQCKEQLNPAIIEKSAVINHAPDIPTVQGDLALLEIVLQNILSNALKFSERPVVDITAKVENNTVLLEIEDNGIGIDEEHHDYIFRPFSRLHCKQSYTGAGLGMAISKKIIKKHGGQIGVRSTLGKGSCFWVRLPAG